MKHIMFVTGVLTSGGAERVISVLAREMANRGYNISIITIYSDENDYLIDTGIDIQYLDCNNKNKIIRSIEIIYKLNSKIRKLNPDIIISFDSMINIYSILGRNILKNKLIISERNDPYQYPESKLLRDFRDNLYRFCDGIVFQTDDAKKYFDGKIKCKSTIIHNPLSEDLPYWNEKREEKKIITASRLSKQKNIPMLIDAFKMINVKFPDYILEIYGKGPLEQELSEKIDNMGLKEKVKLCGFTNDIHYKMSNSEIFVISSNYEGISNSMLEALAIGVPTICTDAPIGGARMFINHGKNGLLVKVGDIDELAIAIENLILNRAKAINLSKEAIKIRNKLTPEKIVNEWIQYCIKISGGNNE